MEEKIFILKIKEYIKSQGIKVDKIELFWGGSTIEKIDEIIYYYNESCTVLVNGKELVFTCRVVNNEVFFE